MLKTVIHIKPIGGLGTGQRVGWGLYIKSIDWRDRIFGRLKQVITKKTWGLQSRYGLGMKWSHRPRPKWGWNLSRRLNSPPKFNKKINEFNCYREFYFKWYKYQSLLTHFIERNRIWLSQTHCSVKEYCKTLHDWNYQNVSDAMSRQ